MTVDPAQTATLTERLTEGVLSVRWPNGDRLEGVTNKTAEMIAAALAPLVTEQIDAERAEIAVSLRELGYPNAAAWLEADNTERAEFIARGGPR